MELLRQRVTRLPVVKPQVICGQIHSTTDYLILVELEASKLYVRYKDDIAGVLDADYRLGTYFRLRVVASDGFVDVYYNGVHKVRHALAAEGCYFKAGCYVQSSTATGDAPTAFAAVDIAELSVSHRRGGVRSVVHGGGGNTWALGGSRSPCAPTCPLESSQGEARGDKGRDNTDPAGKATKVVSREPANASCRESHCNPDRPAHKHGHDNVQCHLIRLAPGHTPEDPPVVDRGPAEARERASSPLEKSQWKRRQACG